MAAEAVAAGGIPQAGSLGYLFIYLHGGKHLPKMDPLLGKIDPYARITLVDPNNDSVRKTHKTKTVTQDYSPKWKDKWAKNLKRFSAYPRVEIELWDHDAMSTDDYGGKAIIELASMGFNGTKPLRKARVPISLAPKLKPSGKASQSEFVVTVGLMPDYKYAKWCLDVSGRPYDGDGSKRLFVPLYEELGPGIEAIVEFEGRKCDVFLVQTQTEAATSSGGEHEAGAGVWTELGFYADVDGQRPAYKIRRESLRASDEDTWKLKGRRVETAKKLDDLDMWTPWNRIFLRSYRYELIYQKTQADIHTAYLKPGIDPTIPVSFEELLTQVQGGASFDVKHKTIYYPIPESPAALLHHPHAEGSSPSSSSSSSSPVTSECLALLSSTFGDDYFDRAVWLSASADPSLVVDLTYEDRRKRTEVHFKSPKQVQTHACTMRVSVDDLKPPCRRSQMTARILKKDLASLREVSLTAILPGVFITYDKKKKNKDFITLPY